MKINIQYCYDLLTEPVKVNGHSQKNGASQKTNGSSKSKTPSPDVSPVVSKPEAPKRGRKRAAADEPAQSQTKKVKGNLK